jgi:3-hydroxyacyl-CoA dehydrogenase
MKIPPTAGVISADKLGRKSGRGFYAYQRAK